MRPLQYLIHSSIPSPTAASSGVPHDAALLERITSLEAELVATRANRQAERTARIRVERELGQLRSPHLRQVATGECRRPRIKCNCSPFDHRYFPERNFRN